MLKAKLMIVGIWLAYCAASLAAGASPADLAILTALALPIAVVSGLLAHHPLCVAGTDLWRWARGGGPPEPSSRPIAGVTLVWLLIMLVTLSDGGVAWATALLGSALAAVVLEERAVRA